MLLEVRRFREDDSTLILIAGLSVLAGFFWDILAWELHLPYPSFHWLERLIHADGKAAYSAMMYETTMFIFVVLSLAWTLLKTRRRPCQIRPVMDETHRHRQAPREPD